MMVKGFATFSSWRNTLFSSILQNTSYHISEILLLIFWSISHSPQLLKPISAIHLFLSNQLRNHPAVKDIKHASVKLLEGSSNLSVIFITVTLQKPYRSLLNVSDIQVIS